jgi:hypothetical protein
MIGQRYKVVITRTADGEQRTYDHGDPHNVWDDVTEYMWTEGNYGCDCNRHLFFHRAAGAEADEDCACGETAYHAHALFDDGTTMEFS